MKRYQMMIGLTILAIAIVIAGVLVSNAIERAGNEVAGQIAGAIRLLSRKRRQTFPYR